MIANIYHALGLHMHQPPGNIESLLRENEWEAKQIMLCYERPLRYVKRYEGIAKVHLGFSGILLDQLMNENLVKAFSKTIDLRRVLFEYPGVKGIEYLGMGYYHPLFPLIPMEDWESQIKRWKQRAEKFGFHAKERRGLKEEHEDWLQEENKTAIWGYILKNRRAWLILFHRGAPTFYELIGVDRTELKEGEELKCKNKDVDARLADEICGILNNPQLRFEYDFMLDELTSMRDDDEGKDFNELGDDIPFWTGGDARYLILLKYYDFLERHSKNILAYGVMWKE